MVHAAVCTSSVVHPSSSSFALLRFKCIRYSARKSVTLCDSDFSTLLVSSSRKYVYMLRDDDVNI